MHIGYVIVFGHMGDFFQQLHLSADHRTVSRLAKSSGGSLAPFFCELCLMPVKARQRVLREESWEAHNQVRRGLIMDGTLHRSEENVPVGRTPEKKSLARTSEHHNGKDHNISLAEFP